MQKKIIKPSRSIGTSTEVEGKNGLVRMTVGSVYRTIVDYTPDEALVLAEAFRAAAADPGQTPTWEHDGIVYDLTMSWRSPRPWYGWHWTWIGEYTPDGVPLMTPHGTEDDGLMDSRVPFDRVLADEKD